MKILVIQTRDIGDVLLSTALCNALKRGIEGVRVEMLTLDVSAGVVEGNPNIDRILRVERSKRNELRANLRLMRELRAERYDAVINVQGQIIGLLACLASGSPRRIGFDKSPWRLGHTDNIALRRGVESSGWGRTLDDRFALLRPLGLEPQERSYKIWLEPAEQQHGRDLLAQAGLDPARPVVALGVNAGDDFKRWPMAHFVQVARWLVEQHGVQVLASFGPGEEEYTRGLRAALPELHDSVFDTLRSKSIRELSCVFSQCALYVGNDTGPRHIAQALDTPALAIVAPASDKRDWIPWDHPRFRALDVGDALGLDADEWCRQRNALPPGEDIPWFAKLEPETVIAELEGMIASLALFASSRPPAASESTPEPRAGSAAS